MKSSKLNQWIIVTFITLSTFILVFISMILIYWNTNLMIPKKDILGFMNYETNYFDAYEDFLIDGENCKIPNLHPFSPNVSLFYQRLRYKKCHELNSLTYIKQDEHLNNYLMINFNEKRKHLKINQNEIKCCYHRIIRSVSNDNNFGLSECMNFISGHALREKEDEFIIATCEGFSKFFGREWFKSEVSSDAHAVVIPKQKVLDKFKKSKIKKEFNFLLIGIDSISRINFIRSMPETFKFVTSNGWYDMKAFNKIGDNTFSNLNAVLNGRNLSTIKKDCDLAKVGEYEKCRFLWNEFNDANYATAYAEDCFRMHTFNYFGTGFVHPPTDHYLRPFNIAAEKFAKPIDPSSFNKKCLGPRHYADVIYQYCVDFSKAYRDDSFFGFFWTNSFSHDELNLPSEYDTRMRFYLEELKTNKILNNTIVIFFSDHGIRFGEIRKYFTGWLEERLPFLYFWLPESFKLKYPELAENLRINQERLVSPFDLHITIKHMLKLEGGYNGNFTAISCPKCQSLLFEVPKNRTCKDAAIDDFWCTCTHFKETDASSVSVKNAVNFAVDHLNSELSIYENCAKLTLSKVMSAREYSQGSLIVDYLISFEVLPSEGQMEGTVRCSGLECENGLKIIGEISRINKYGNQSGCIIDAYLRKYCFCV